MRSIFISYEEAKRLKPAFRELRKMAPWKEARESSSRILEELELVRKDVDYDPRLGGKQLILNEMDYDFLVNVINQLGD